MSNIILTVILLCCIFSISRINGLCERSAMEKRCLTSPPPVFKDVDFKWVMGVDTWYFTYGSKLDVYRTASDLNRVPISEMKDEDLYYDSCMTMKWGPGPAESTMYGFNGKKAVFPTTPVSEGVFKFKAEFLGVQTLSYVTLTDNKSFIFFYNCYDDGEAAWAVNTATKSIDKETAKKIYDHAKSLGFNEKQFVNMRFDTCSQNTQKKGGNKNEL